jgi:6-pyruvoyl-tetrahydropterin synthase
MTKFTSIGTVISVGHNSPEGVAHGHSYEVWVKYRFGPDMRRLREQVETVTKRLDHTFLPDELSLSENLAEHIGKQLPGCLEVACRRPLEMWAGGWVNPNVA